MNEFTIYNVTVIIKVATTTALLSSPIMKSSIATTFRRGMERKVHTLLSGPYKTNAKLT